MVGLTRIKHTCDTCGKVFSMQSADYKKRISHSKSGKLYCSRVCADKGMVRVKYIT